MSSDLLEAIYETALAPARWSEVLGGLTHLVGMDTGGAQLLVVDERGGIPLNVGYGIQNPEAERLYQQYYGAIDPRREQAMSYAVGDWMVCHRHFDERYVSRSEFYQDYLIPKLGNRYMAGVRLAAEKGMHVLLAVGNRAGPDAKPVTPEELRLLRDLTPHLTRAARLNLRIRQLEGELATRDAALDRLAMAVMIVERDAALRYANAQGEAVLETPGAPLACRLGRLVCRSARQSNRFAASIAAAVDERRGDGLLLEGVDGSLSSCVVVPLSPRLALARPWERPMAMIVITENGAGFPVDSATLRALFGLTPAESRLATGLAAGQSLEGYAAASGISPMTARAQLRAVFAKVGVHRQAELAVLLQRIAQVRSS